MRMFKAAVLCIGLAAAAHAQLTRGFISGTVQDATGAVVPGVVVKITNRATNIESQTETNRAGLYRFVAVEPGIYGLEFSKSGFETVKVENIEVSTIQEVTVNQTLKVGTATTVVEVVEAPPGVELAKSTATIDRIMPQIVIQNVPLTGNLRDVNTLALLAPTVGRGPGSTGISANGSRARNNNFMVDGVDNNDISVTLSANRVLPEALSEFQVQTAAYSAEFGRNTGAQINVITRGGSNEFHGEAWDIYRGNWMEPVSLLNKRAGVLKTPRYVQNQAGGTLGGRIIRDRTFFFGLLETNRRREAADARNASAFTIPTPAGYAALASVPLGEGQTQASRQAVLSAISFLPEVHQRVGGNYQGVRPVTINGVAIETGNARIPLANPHNFWYLVNRIDHKLTAGNTLSYRAHYDKRDQPDVVSNLQFGSRWSGAQTILGQNHALSLTSSVTPRFINEFRASYVRRNLDFPENDPVTPTTTILSAFTIGGLSNFPQGRIQNTFQYQDVATALVGRHSLKFGADFRRVRLFNRSGFDSKGTWTFNSIADFINNRAFSLVQAVNEATFDARQLIQNYFFQDDFKVTKDLTFNLGLRYEYHDIPFGFFGAANDQIAATRVPRDVKPDKNNWAPRIGFAYSPSNGGRLLGNGRTVFRGGFGMGYDVLFYNILTVTASNYPRVVTARTDNAQNLFPALAPKIATLPPYNPLLTMVNANTDMQNPTSHYYSFTIQREVGDAHVFEIGYSGNRQYHAIRQGRLNPGVLTPAQAATVLQTGNGNSIPALQARRLYPTFGDRVSIESTAISNYNAGFIRYDRRFKNGLLIGANYTYSALFSDNDESLGVAAITNSSPQVPQSFFDYRPEYSRSAFDLPHRYSVHYVYNILDGHQFRNRFLEHVLGGWRIAGFTEWQSGQAFGIRTGVDTVGQGATNGARPDYNPSGAFTKDPVEGNLRTFRAPLQGGAFITPLTAGGSPLLNTQPAGGNLGRNTFRGPAHHQWNFNFGKTFNVTERLKMDLRSDWINLWNHRNFGNPVAAMNAPNFGDNTTDPGGRTVLVGLKLRF